VSATVEAPDTSGTAPGATRRVQLRLLINGNWVPGSGGHLTSVNPSRPEEIVAEGGVAVLEDLDKAVLAARGSQGPGAAPRSTNAARSCLARPRPWSRKPTYLASNFPAQTAKP
jgi:hypothetical protein